jgi:Na+/H+ antiporter NhaD/arsenite permease-like protein
MDKIEQIRNQPISIQGFRNFVYFVFFSFAILGIYSLSGGAFASLDGASSGNGITPEAQAALLKHPGAIFCLVIFLLSYLLVLLEEKTHLRKSKPVMLGAGIIWVTIGIIAPSFGFSHEDVHDAVFHGLSEYASLLLFLLAAMTYLSAMQDRQVFDVLRTKLIKAGLNKRQLFWTTGIMAFFLSPVADNLTTSLVLGAVIMAVGASDKKFIGISCVNIVCAANAGGVFSPFGDITSLMVWQAGHIEFLEFFDLFLPSVACFIIPAVIMSFFVSKEKPWHMECGAKLKPGAKTIIFLGISTIAMAVGFEQMLGLPPFIGMMTGLSLLMFFAYFIRHRTKNSHDDEDFDIIDTVAASEWDTLLFFFGVIFSVGGLAFLGYMEIVSNLMYVELGPTVTNISLGFASALIDNIPVMFAVLTMEPDMSHFQWLLITLTTGVGGSMLSIGSAAGVALMGVARGSYSFMSHLKWTPIIMLGYAAAIWVHFLVNGHMNLPHEALDAVGAITPAVTNAH